MKFKKKLSTISNKINMKQKTCAEIIGEAEEKIKNSQVTNAAYEYSDSLKKTVIIHGFGKNQLDRSISSWCRMECKSKSVA